VKAHQIDSRFHPFPKTVPKFIDSMPKFDQAWLDEAYRSAAERRGETPSAPTVAVTPAQIADRDAERKRIADQTECAAGKRLLGENPDCGKAAICRGCPQAETPGKGRYTPGPDSTGLTPGGELKRVGGQP
jgi:hypothetical protein